jgi:hypothetical protein
MKKLYINLFIILTISFFAYSFIDSPVGSYPKPSSDCEVDTSRIAVVELTVFGMDSITITDVQDRLDETCGVSFNFACWADTMVFIEYDSVLTDKQKLMAVIEEMGYKPSVKHHH